MRKVDTLYRTAAVETRRLDVRAVREVAQRRAALASRAAAENSGSARAVRTEQLPTALWIAPARTDETDNTAIRADAATAVRITTWTLRAPLKRPHAE